MVSTGFTGIAALKVWRGFQRSIAKTRDSLVVAHVYIDVRGHMSMMMSSNFKPLNYGELNDHPTSAISSWT